MFVNESQFLTAMKKLAWRGRRDAEQRTYAADAPLPADFYLALVDAQGTVVMTYRFHNTSVSTPAIEVGV